MFYIEFNVVNLFAVLVAGHLISTFVEWFVHYVQHQRLFGIDFYRIHLHAHHDLKLERSNPDTHRRWLLLGHVQWLVFMGTAAVGCFMLLTPWAAVAIVIESLVTAASTYYFHREYDNSASRLNRFEWFRTARALHRIHHGQYESFTKSRNYAIGGPLTGFLADRVLGTFHGVRGRS